MSAYFKATLVSLAIPLAVIAAPVTVMAQSPADDLSAVSAHIRAVGTMTADFSQTDRKGGRSSGALLLKRPGQIRFEYGKDMGFLIVGDGKSLNVIDYQVKQVQRWPIRNSPLSALLDPSRDLSRYGRVVPTTNPNVLSVAVKDPKRPEYGTITMIFLRDSSAPAGLTLQSWVALDSQNNRTTVRLSNIRYNQNIADSAFTWRDPRPRRTPGR